MGSMMYISYIYIHIHTYIHTYIHTLHYITLHCIALHCIALHCIALHCIALHCITLHYITLHYITLHYITYIHTLHTYIHLCIMVCLCRVFTYMYVQTYIYIYILPTIQQPRGTWRILAGKPATFLVIFQPVSGNSRYQKVGRWKTLGTFCGIHMRLSWVLGVPPVILLIWDGDFSMK